MPHYHKMIVKYNLRFIPCLIYVHHEQEETEMMIMGTVGGLAPGKHGFHIHEVDILWIADRHTIPLSTD